MKNYSIIIPSSSDNLEYLKICISSIKKNSKFKHEIIVHLNNYTSESLKYLDENEIKYLKSKQYLGLCAAVNLAAKLSTNDYIMYCHDDMYLCPGWDQALYKHVQLYKNFFYLSGVMIECDGGHIRLNCGNSFDNFDEKKLINELKTLKYFDYQGSHWAPHLIHKDDWKRVGGFSEEFDPGFGSDPDLNKKLWDHGIRIFKGISNFFVYHFGSVTTRKNKKNILKINGSKIFLKKHGITIKFFNKYYLKGEVFKDKIIYPEKYTSPLKEPKKNLFFVLEWLVCKIKYFFLLFKN